MCRWAIALAMASLIGGCSDEPAAERDRDGSSSATSGGGQGSDGAFELLFEEHFDGLGPPSVAGYPELPEALFPADGSRWTKLNNTHPDTNTLAWVPDGFLRMSAVGLSGTPASKMDIEKALGLAFREGDILRVRVDLRVPGAPGDTFPDNTFIDIEDSDDLRLDGVPTGAGLRIRTNDRGHLAVDRGELLGEGGAEPPRLDNFNSQYLLPVGEWVTVEATIKLGVNVPMSDVAPIDPRFDAATTAAWVELYVTTAQTPRELVLRQPGTTFLDRTLGPDLVAEALPDVDVEWPEDLDFNSFQVGMTNNVSASDRSLEIDNVRVDVIRTAR